MTGLRIGRRAAGPDHNQILALLKEAGKDGAEVERNLGRLLPLKTKTEYDPDDIPASEATRECVNPQWPQCDGLSWPQRF